MTVDLYYSQDIAIGMLLVAILVAGEISGKRWLVYISKPAASLYFIHMAHQSGALTSQTAVGFWMYWALWLSLGGDMFLMFKAKPMFLGGLVSFLLGHVCYIQAFLLLQPKIFSVSAAQFTVSAAVTSVSIMAFGFWPKIEQGLKVPVAAYTFVITIMIIVAYRAFESTSRVIVVVAAILFYLSDIAVALSKFITPNEWTHRAWGLPTYFYAQFLFAQIAGTFRV